MPLLRPMQNQPWLTKLRFLIKKRPAGATGLEPGHLRDP